MINHKNTFNIYFEGVFIDFKGQKQCWRTTICQGLLNRDGMVTTQAVSVEVD